MATQDRPEHTDPSRQNSILTTQQRKFLQSNISNTPNATTTRARIRERVREGIRDFRLLATQLETRDREAVFPDPDLKGYEAGYEFKKIQGDVGNAVAFLYAGLGGESGFRDPFRNGVRNGEVMVGNAARPLHVEPRLTVDFLSHIDLREAVDTVERGEWDRLSDRSLLAVIRLAWNTDAIDFEEVHSALDRHEEAKELLNERQTDSEAGSDSA